jgi:predicted dehydrogenase
MKKIHDSGEIGKIFNIESRVHGSRGIPSDWRGMKKYGGGMIYDWGIHLIDQIMMIKGKDIKKVFCRLDNITNKEVDDGFKLNLLYEDGTTALVEVGTYNFLPLPRFYMQCENGSAKIEDWQHKCHVAKLKAWQEKDVTPVQNAAGITKTMAPRDELTLDEYDIDIPKSDVHNFYRNVCAVLEKGEESLIKLPEVRRVLCVMEAAFASDAQGQAINVEI